MVKRKIVKIDEEKCTGCGLCVDACHEGALQLIGGKAKLVSESYCDGLGACLPECPAGAITLEEREAAAFDEGAVRKHVEAGQNSLPEKLACGCAGVHTKIIERKEDAAATTAFSATGHAAPAGSQLRQWPCQIKLVPVNASYFDRSHLLVAADCTAYAYANVHDDFMRNKITMIGCPKLDDMDYSEKLTEIVKAHEIKSITVLQMEVPCCGGMANAVKQTLINSGKMIPWRIITIATDGRIVDE